MRRRLLRATPEGEDPVALLQSAARGHIPVHPKLRDSAPTSSQVDVKGKCREVPEPDQRPSIEEVITDIEQQDWYQEQIQYRRVFEARCGQLGALRNALQGVLRFHTDFNNTKLLWIPLFRLLYPGPCGTLVKSRHYIPTRCLQSMPLLGTGT